VPIDIRNETLIGLRAAARMLPPGRRGRPVTLSCLFRWIVDGVKLSDGSVCRLAGVRMGGRWLTSVEALQRFAEAQTPRVQAEKGPASWRSPARRQRDSERAAKELERAGI
jgi:hypothetical protein